MFLMMHSCMEWKEGCVHHTTRCLFTFRELFSRTFVALEILKNSDKQRIWPHYLWIKDEIRKNSYKHNQAQRNLIHDVASIVSMLFFCIWSGTVRAMWKRGKGFLTEVQWPHISSHNNNNHQMSKDSIPRTLIISPFFSLDLYKSTHVQF